jgi:hypothetical protein
MEELETGEVCSNVVACLRKTEKSVQKGISRERPHRRPVRKWVIIKRILEKYGVEVKN